MAKSSRLTTTASNIYVSDTVENLLLRQMFGFDAMGNRLQSKDMAAQVQVDSSYNRLNQLVAQSTSNFSGATPVTLSTTSYGFDGDGNQTSAVTQPVNGTASGAQYRYDDFSRLVSVETPGASREEFVYDGMSRLRISRSYEWQNGAWVQNAEKRRVYDGMDVVQERDGNNAVTASVTRAGNIGGILARSTPASGTSYFAYDLQGNVTTLTDSSGAVVGSYAYDAWGNVVVSSGARAGENPYRFSTKESLAGMSFFGFRFYNAGTGRWLNRDPIRESGGVNLYSAMGNDPVNSTDEYGLDTIRDVLRDWYNETNTPTRIYTPQNQVTVGVRKDEGVAQARADYAKNGNGKSIHTYQYKFGVKEYARELGQVASGKDEVGTVLGSYGVTIRRESGGRVRYIVENTTGWESGTRTPVPGAGKNPSIEDIVNGKGWPNARGPKSILNDRPRSAPGPGGNFRQIYTWFEKDPNGCGVR